MGGAIRVIIDTSGLVGLRRNLASFVCMKNVTVTLDDEVARWARIWAARHNSSVSKLLGEHLAERMREETGYEAAMRRFLSRRPTRLKNQDEPYPDRDELH